MPFTAEGGCTARWKPLISWPAAGSGPSAPSSAVDQLPGPLLPAGGEMAE
jgi:hypothetical protein